MIFASLHRIVEKTKRQQDKKRVYYVMSGQFCTLAIFTHFYTVIILSLQVVGLVASHVQASIRGSLLVSLLLQLVDDRDSRVAQTAVRSLALLAHLLDDSDKLSQVTRELWQPDSFFALSFRCLSKQ